MSEKNDGEGVRSGGGVKTRVTSAGKKPQPIVPIVPVTSSCKSIASIQPLRRGPGIHCLHMHGIDSKIVRKLSVDDQLKLEHAQV